MGIYNSYSPKPVVDPTDEMLWGENPGNTVRQTFAELEAQIGGSAISFYDAYVKATGGDYSNIGAAFAAGKKRLLVDGAVTETGIVDITGLEDVTIVGINSAIADFAGFTFDGTVTDSVYSQNIKFITALTSNTQFFGQNFENFTLSHCTIEDNAAVQHKITNFSSSTRKVRIEFCRIEFSNSVGGLQIVPTGTNGGQVTINECELVGGGASCDTAIILNYGWVTNCRFSGTFNAAAVGIDAIIENCHNSATDLVIDSIQRVSTIEGNDVILRIEDIPLVENVPIASILGNPPQLKCVIRNCEFNFNLAFNMAIFGNGEVYMYDCNINGNLNFGRRKSLLQGCFITGNLVIDGFSDVLDASDNSINDNYIEGSLTVDEFAFRNSLKGNTALLAGTIDGDDNALSQNWIGTTAETITLSATSDGNYVIYNYTKAAIVDSGTNNVITPNKLF